MAFPTLDYDLSNKTDVPSSLGGKAIQMVRFSKSVTTAMLALGIVTKFGQLPAGSRIVGGYLEVPDLDTGGSPALTIGIGYRDALASVDDVDGILDAVTTGQAGGLNTTFLTAGVDRQFTYDTDITFTAEAAAATAAAGTVVLVLFVVLP
jgi:hypothetical protein